MINTPLILTRSWRQRFLCHVLLGLTFAAWGLAQEEARDVSVPHPRFWECNLEGGIFIIALADIVTVSKHEYLVDGVGRVFETTLSSRSSVIARFYYQETIANATPLKVGKDALERAQELAEGVAERTGTEPLWKKAAKSYPTTTHAHTIEYRLEDKETVDLIFSHASTAWKEGRGAVLTIENE